MPKPVELKHVMDIFRTFFLLEQQSEAFFLWGGGGYKQVLGKTAGGYQGGSLCQPNPLLPGRQPTNAWQGLGV